jgi:hypothetical protein
MGKINDLTQGNLGEADRQAHRDRYATPMNGGSIGRGGLRVYDGGVITIENGGLRVTGTAEIIGTLIASGVINFTGDVNISGPLDVTGLVTLMSDLVVASGGKITAGSIELNPDGSAKFGSMTISPAGKITSGSAEINPDGSAKFGSTTISPDGTIAFGPGLSVTPDNGAGDAAIMNGASQIVLTPDNLDYWAQFTGGAYFQGRVSAMDIRLNGLLTTAEKPNLHVGADGIVKRSTA